MPLGARESDRSICRAERVLSPNRGHRFTHTANRPDCRQSGYDHQGRRIQAAGRRERRGSPKRISASQSIGRRVRFGGRNGSRNCGFAWTWFRQDARAGQRSAAYAWRPALSRCRPQQRSDLARPACRSADRGGGCRLRLRRGCRCRQLHPRHEASGLEDRRPAGRIPAR